MNHVQLERHQVWLYLPAVVAGVLLGVWLRPVLPDAAIYLPLIVLLYATFVQLPITHLPAAFRNWRFMSAALIANFVFVPTVVWLLGWLAPPDRAIVLGVYLVLLVPCTDWYIVFSRLSQGDARLAITSTPILLLAQFLLLPLYLWLFLGEGFTEVIEPGPFIRVFVALIMLPLLAAAATKLWADRRGLSQSVIHTMNWVPVPALAVVMFLIALSHAADVVAEWQRLVQVVFVFVLFLILAPVIAVITARWFGLAIHAERTLIFSMGTRNSFVVLPFALALPAGWEMAAAVIVLQSLVELLGVLVYVRYVPRWGARHPVSKISV